MLVLVVVDVDCCTGWLSLLAVVDCWLLIHVCCSYVGFMLVVAGCQVLVDVDCCCCCCCYLCLPWLLLLSFVLLCLVVRSC